MPDAKKSRSENEVEAQAEPRTNRGNEGSLRKADAVAKGERRRAKTQSQEAADVEASKVSAREKLRAQAEEIKARAAQV